MRFHERDVRAQHDRFAEDGYERLLLAGAVTAIRLRASSGLRTVRCRHSSDAGGTRFRVRV